MDDKLHEMVLDLKKRLPDSIKRHIRQMIPLDSTIGIDGIGSPDLDLLILVDKENNEMEQTLKNIAYQVMWDNDFRPILFLKILTETQFLNSLEQDF